MNRKRTFSIIFLLILVAILSCPSSLYGQGHSHSHARNEVGISPGAIYSPSHNSWGFGIHAHYFRTLGDHSRWAFGGGVEKAFLHGGHWTIGAGARYNLLDCLSIAVMPGVTFLNHDEHEGEEMHSHAAETKFSLHVEVAYDLFHLEHFHFGPAIDYSWSKGDSHFMLGIHCAYLF